MYNLKRLIQDVCPIYQITVVGSHVTIYTYANEEKPFTFNGHQLCVWADLDPIHNDAHGNNFLATFRDKSFNHFHVILPGKDSLEKELRSLLKCDQVIYGITDLQIEGFIGGFQKYTSNYSPLEHKLAIRNLISSAIRYNYEQQDSDELDEENGSDQQCVSSIESVGKALAQSMLDRNYNSFENFRKVLQDNLNNLDVQQKNTLLGFIDKCSPFSPYKDFNRLVGGGGLMGNEPSLAGLGALILPPLLAVLSIAKITSLTDAGCADTDAEQLNAQEAFGFAAQIIGLSYAAYKGPEIAESIYNQGRQLVFGQPEYVVNESLRTLVNEHQNTHTETSKPRTL